MQYAAYVLIQLLVIIMLAPLLDGIIRKIKAFSQKRTGIPLLQVYYDLLKLLRKTSVVSEESTWVYKIAPYIVFSTSIAAALLVPVTTKIMPGTLPGDIILLISILGLGRFFTMLAALDTASMFGGMGSSREAMVSILIEPSVLVSLFMVGLISKSTSLPQIMQAMKGIGAPLTYPVFVMIFLAFLIIIIAESSRIPVDDPSTHLELTMVHEAMMLEYSGRHLAIMELGAMIKQLVLITLLVNILIPHDQLIAVTGIGALVVSIFIYVAKVITVTIIIAIAEVCTVKLRFFSIPNLATLSFILLFLGFLQYFILGGSNV